MQNEDFIHYFSGPASRSGQWRLFKFGLLCIYKALRKQILTVSFRKDGV